MKYLFPFLLLTILISCQEEVQSKLVTPTNSTESQKEFDYVDTLKETFSFPVLEFEKSYEYLIHFNESGKKRYLDSSIYLFDSISNLYPSFSNTLEYAASLDEVGAKTEATKRYDLSLVQLKNHKDSLYLPKEYEDKMDDYIEVYNGYVQLLKGININIDSLLIAKDKIHPDLGFLMLFLPMGQTEEEIRDNLVY